MKISLYINKFCRIYKSYGVVSIKVLYYKIMQHIIRDEGKRHYYFYKEYQCVKNYIYRKYKSIIFKYKESSDKGNDNLQIENRCNIYVFWYQGYESAPEIIKTCIDRLLYIYNDRVIIINKDNFKDYADIPKRILELLDQKVISFTNFSDLLRLSVLRKNGGIWIDAGIYSLKPFDLDMYIYPFYTIKHGLFSDWHVCKGLWTIGLFCSGKNNTIINYLYDVLTACILDHKTFLDYLMFDSVLALGYENIQSIQEMINKVPINNCRFFELDKKINETYNELKFKMIVKGDSLFRIGWKQQFYKMNGEEITNYEYLLLNGRMMNFND